MALRSLLEEFETEPVDHAIVVARDSDETDQAGNDDQPGPLEEMLADLFDEQPIDVSADPDEQLGSALEAVDLEPSVARELAAAGDTAVLLEDDEPVAASSMPDLYDAILAINSDLFVTGVRELGEIDLPDVLAGLAETRLRLRGYPLAHKEKLVLIVLSRYVEQLAWAGGSGTHRAAFQQLSRIDDEVGTREVYQQLDRTNVDVHVYGVDDGVPESLDATVHAGDDAAYRNAWFVVYRPDERANPATPGALVCWEVEPRVWDGAFTFDPDRVATIEETIAQSL